MKYAYFPGCSLHSTALEYGNSTKEICKKIGIELQEIPDWNCCGATPAHQTNRYLASALPLRNIAKAEEMGLDMVIPCAACFSRSKFAQYAVEKDGEFRKKVVEAVGLPYEGKVKIKHLLQAFSDDIGLEEIKKKVTKPLTGLKVACYYGCLLTRPPEVAHFDDPEEPQIMENLLKALGAEPVEWAFKTECCGASFAVSNIDAMVKLTVRILKDAMLNKSDCIVVACPLCHANLDMRQKQISHGYNYGNFNIPVYYFTELVGVACGIPVENLNIGSHLTNALDLLREKQLISA